MAYTLERMFEVWDDGSGSSIEIGPDRDGLDLVEVRARDQGKIVARITMSKEQAALVAKALSEASL